MKILWKSTRRKLFESLKGIVKTQRLTSVENCAISCSVEANKTSSVIFDIFSQQALSLVNIELVSLCVYTTIVR